MARAKIGNVFPPLSYLMKHCAPTGYGLGEVSGKTVLWSKIDDAKKFGLWSILGDDGVKTVNGITFSYARVLVIPLNETSVTQILFPVGNNGLMLIRKCESNVWGEWEWNDPPMTPGVEYLTTETWYGSPVYTKLIETGTLNDAKNIVDGKTPVRRILRHYGYIDKHSLPFIDGTLDGANSAWVNATVYNDNINLIFHLGTEMRGKGAVVQLWYLK